MVKFTLRLLFSRDRTRYQPQIRTGRFWVKKIFCAYRDLSSGLSSRQPSCYIDYIIPPTPTPSLRRARFQTFDAVQSRTPLSWDDVQCMFVVVYRSCGTACRSHCVTPEGGTDRPFHGFDKQLPTYAVYRPKRQNLSK